MVLKYWVTAVQQVRTEFVRRRVKSLAYCAFLAFAGMALGVMLLLLNGPEPALLHSWYRHNEVLGAQNVLDDDCRVLYSRTISPSIAWYGIRRVPMQDMRIVADNLGGRVVELTVRTETAAQINVMLDQIEILGYLGVLNMYASTTHTKRPWYWNGSEWAFPQDTIETLQGVSNHPALLAVYALHEPLDEGAGYVSVEQQHALYQLLQAYTDGLPVFTDIGGLSVWENRGVALADGICDYCCTFPSHFRSDWASEQCITETLRRIDADLDTQRRLMPNSQIVFLINTYSCPNCYYPFRLPTAEEAAVVRDYLCALDQPMMYYPWAHSAYSLTLNNSPQLWPVVIEGCAPLSSDLSGSAKSTSHLEARVGDTLVYTLTVDNSGEMATAFSVTDTLDTDITFAGFVGTSPGSFDHTANVITWTGTVSGMEQVQLVFLAIVGRSALTAITNTVYIDGGTERIVVDTVSTAIVTPVGYMHYLPAIFVRH